MSDNFNYHFSEEDSIDSPSLIYYLDQIEENTKRVITMAGGAQRLWPHVKSHKMAAMVKMQLNFGITRFKCATIAETEMCARENAAHVLLAYPLIGPMITRFLDLRACYAKTNFWAIGDNIEQLKILASYFSNNGAESAPCPLNVLIDVNCGMNRTGVPLDGLENFYREADKIEELKIIGLHCYDGHLGIGDIKERTAEVKKITENILKIKTLMEKKLKEEPVLIMGGTPTFPVHMNTQGVFLSPGTIFINDSGYSAKYPDLNFTAGGAILTRVISRPAPGLFTLDTGHKAISSDKTDRGIIAGMPDAKPITHSEEHWVWNAGSGTAPEIGTLLYIIPCHICPTTALYPGVHVISKGKLTDYWEVTARNRFL